MALFIEKEGNFEHLDSYFIGDRTPITSLTDEIQAAGVVYKDRAEGVPFSDLGRKEKRILLIVTPEKLLLSTPLENSLMSLVW